MGIVVSLNGVITSPDEATVSVFDRGFLYGDSVYEVVRTYDGVPFAVGPHLDRLRGSARQVHLDLPCTDEEFRADIDDILREAGNDESYVRLIVTRGAGPIDLHPGRAEDPLRILIAQPLVVPTPEQWERGLAVAIVDRLRNDPDALDPAAKTGNYLNNVLAIVEARERGADDAVLLNRNGRVTEGTTANVFIVKDDVVKTPPLRSGILGGITRSIVLDVLERAGRPGRETALRPEQLTGADEAFFTSTTRGVLPVTSVDGRPVGDGRPGPVTRWLSEVFEAHVRAR